MEKSDCERLAAELERFVDYYEYRAGQLGNGEAYRHFLRAAALLAELDDKAKTKKGA